jgi:hypothetical protein
VTLIGDRVTDAADLDRVQRALWVVELPEDG